MLLKLKGKKLISLDLAGMIAGAKYRGEFEDRVKKVMEEVRKAKNVILFIDELHTIIGTGGNDTLRGGSGSDTYVYSLGDGNDLIQEDGSSSDIDVLKFKNLKTIMNLKRKNKSGGL